MGLSGAAKNTDRELFRERLDDASDPGDYYAPSVHVTQDGMIGMNVGGHVIVMPIGDWHKAARYILEKKKQTALIAAMISTRVVALNRGEREGVVVGDPYALGDPPLAILAVTEVYEKFSIAVAVWVSRDCPVVHRGDELSLFDPLLEDTSCAKKTWTTT